MPVIPRWKGIKAKKRLPLNSLKLSLSFSVFPVHQMPFIHPCLHPPFFLSSGSVVPVLVRWVLLCHPAAWRRDGTRFPGLWGSRVSEIPRTTSLVTDGPDPAATPYSTLLFPGKHLLCSLGRELASNVPPHSCLGMPITVYTTQPWALEKHREGARERKRERARRKQG